jgi:WD40 repeat protein
VPLVVAASQGVHSKVDLGQHRSAPASSEPQAGPLLLQVLAVASDDGKVRLYSTKSGEQVSDLGGHEDAVQAVAFDPAGQFMVTGSSDNTFRLWA